LPPLVARSGNTRPSLAVAKIAHFFAFVFAIFDSRSGKHAKILNKLARKTQSSFPVFHCHFFAFAMEFENSRKREKREEKKRNSQILSKNFPIKTFD